jgi:hypothetical protein
MRGSPLWQAPSGLLPLDRRVLSKGRRGEPEPSSTFPAILSHRAGSWQNRKSRRRTSHGPPTAERGVYGPGGDGAGHTFHPPGTRAPRAASLTPAAIRTIPTSTPTVVIDVWLSRRTNQAMISHAKIRRSGDPESGLRPGRFGRSDLERRDLNPRPQRPQLYQGGLRQTPVERSWLLRRFVGLPGTRSEGCGRG